MKKKSVIFTGNSYPVEENPRDKVEFRIEAVSLNAKSMEKLTPLEFEKFATFFSHKFWSPDLH